MSTYFRQIRCDILNEYSVIIEDDSRVCYAYLLLDNSIIGHVWLYNQAATPDKTDWSFEEDMPFLNPTEFVIQSIEPLVRDEDIRVDFFYAASGAFWEVGIYVRGELVAILMPDSKPGWSTKVGKDGPVAKRHEM